VSYGIMQVAMNVMRSEAWYAGRSFKFSTRRNRSRSESFLAGCCSSNDTKAVTRSLFQAAHYEVRLQNNAQVVVVMSLVQGSDSVDAAELAGRCVPAPACRRRRIIGQGVPPTARNGQAWKHRSARSPKTNLHASTMQVASLRYQKLCCVRRR